MAVDALHQDGAPVDQEAPALDLHAPEAHILRDHFEHVARRTLDGQQQLIQVRIFRRPLVRSGRGHRDFGGGLALAGDLHRAGRGLAVRRARRIEQRGGHGDFRGLLRSVGDGALDHQRSVAILVVEVGLHFEIAQVLFRRRPEVDVAEDAAHAPHVLIFQIGAVAEAIHLHRQQIAARLQVRGDVELRRRAAVLAVAQLVPVDPRVEGRVHAVEMQQDLPALPRRRHGEVHAVAAHRIELVRRGGRLRSVLRERINNVGVDGDVEAVHLPAGRHRHVAPGGVAVIRAVEIDGALRRAQRAVELPGSVQQLEPRRFGAIHCAREFGRRVSHHGGVRLLGAYVYDRRVVPLRPDLRKRRRAKR